MAASCYGCFAGLVGKTQGTAPRALGPSAAGLVDMSPRNKVDDEVPTIARPRVGSWASPVPYSPLPWATWQREASEEADGHGTAEFSMDVLEGRAARSEERHRLAAPVVPSTLATPTMFASPNSMNSLDRRRRLRELDLEAQRLGHHRPGSNSQRLPQAVGGMAIGPGYTAEQLLASPGSLPAPFSPAAREQAQERLIQKALKELPHTLPFAERITRVPRRLLTLRGPHGQNFRREMLRGAVIVFFSAGYEGKRFIYERAHALGVRSVLIDSPDSWSRSLVAEGKLSKFIPIDMSQPSDVVYNTALREIMRLQDDPAIGPPDGIATFVELSVQTASRLAEKLGLPGPLPESVDLARDKHRTRAALAAAGLPTPPNYLIEGNADLPVAARKVGFPAVLKPVSGAASLGVKKVNTEAELQSTYDELYNELSSLVVSSGALVKNDGSGMGTAASSVIGVKFLLERYLDGNEVDVDIVMSEGEWQYAAVSDNGPTLEPYFNETWAVSPSLLPRKQQVALKELAVGAVKALGFDDGIFHVECKYTSVGPHLIEVNARMGGGPVHQTNLRCWNVDLVEETLFIAVGVPARPDVPREPKECIANSDINVLRSGRLADMSFLEPLRHREGVISFSPHVKAGDEVVGPLDGLPTWLTELVVTRPTPREALDFLLKLESEVQERVRLL